MDKQRIIVGFLAATVIVSGCIEALDNGEDEVETDLDYTVGPLDDYWNENASTIDSEVEVVETEDSLDIYLQTMAPATNYNSSVEEVEIRADEVFVETSLEEVGDVGGDAMTPHHHLVEVTGDGLEEIEEVEAVLEGEEFTVTEDEFE